MATGTTVVLRVSPMAHIAVGFGLIGLLALVLAQPLTAPLLLVAVIMSAMILRLRTVATSATVTARTLTGSRTVDWADIEGLAFVKGSWARARLTSGDQLRLPAVTFATLPQLTAISGGRVPNPYDPRSAQRVGPVEQDPGADADADAQR